jgi:hypothetical protein
VLWGASASIRYKKFFLQESSFGMCLCRKALLCFGGPAKTLSIRGSRACVAGGRRFCFSEKQSQVVLVSFGAALGGTPRHYPLVGSTCLCCRRAA